MKVSRVCLIHWRQHTIVRRVVRSEEVVVVVVADAEVGRVMFWDWDDGIGLRVEVGHEQSRQRQRHFLKMALYPLMFRRAFIAFVMPLLPQDIQCILPTMEGAVVKASSSLSSLSATLQKKRARILLPRA